MVRDVTAGMPGLMAYAGGEICPIVLDDGSVLNHFQNGAFVMCTI
jgi:hypothetical protein